MEFVCQDPSGDTWYYSGEKYLRLNAGEVRSRISGKYLPDPIKLWESRAKKNNHDTCTPEDRPSPATFALYKHWEGVNAQ